MRCIWRWLFWPASIGLALPLSCGSSSDGATIVGITDASTGAGGAAGASGLGGSSNSNGSTGGTGVIVIGPSDASVSGDALVGTVGSGSLEDASCAAESHQGQQLPLDLYIMLDSSGSMLETLTPTTTTTKWDAVRSALGSFLNDPASAGLGVGIQYFPLVQPNVSEICDPTTQATDCGQFGPCDVLNACNNTTTVTGCNTVADCPVTNPRGQCLRLGLCRVSTGFACSFVQGRTTLCSGDPTDICLPIGGNCRLRDSCDATRYAMPAVDVAPLPGAAMGLINSLNAHMPTGLTPTSGALSGALSHARALATANPMHRVVVVLATDGLPTECTPADIPGIGALASAAAAATPSISTFVVGVFSPAEAIDAQPNLDALARAGNTGSAIVVNTGQDVTAAFLAALNAIRTTALACDYDIPQPEAGRLDYGKVNVQFTSGAGQKLTIGYVGAAANCGTNGAAGGWYYDVDPSTGTPTRIVVCDATCNGFKADPSGAVKILLGCTTQALIR